MFRLFRSVRNSGAVYVTPLLLGILLLLPVASEGAMIVVPDDYPTIQAAINAAQPGDIIKVRDGVYMEADLNMENKTDLELKGAVGANVVVQGNGTLPVFRLTDVRNIVLGNLKLKNGNDGIKITGNDNADITISGLNMEDIAQSGIVITGEYDFKLSCRNLVMPLGKGGRGEDGFKAPTMESTARLEAVGVSVSNAVNGVDITTVKAGAKVDFSGVEINSLSDVAFNISSIQGDLEVAKANITRSGGILHAETISGSVSLRQNTANEISGMLFDATTITGSVAWEDVTISDVDNFVVNVQRLEGSFSLRDVNGTSLEKGFNFGKIEQSASLTYTYGSLRDVGGDVFEVDEFKGSISFNKVDGSTVPRFMDIHESSATASLSYTFGTVTQNNTKQSLFELSGNARYNIEKSDFDSYGVGIKYMPDDNFSMGLRLDSTEMTGDRDVSALFFLEFRFQEDYGDGYYLMNTENLVEITNSAFSGASIGIDIHYCDNVYIACSTVTDNFIGIRMNQSLGLLYNNIITNNRDYAVAANKECVEAMRNYWGDFSGPLDNRDDREIHPDCGFYNPDGEGDKVSNFIDYGDYASDSLDISIELFPPADTDIGQGEYITFGVVITNNNMESEADFAYWVFCVRPTEDRYVPWRWIDHDNPLMLHLEPGEVFEMSTTLQAPYCEPTGPHTVIGEIGIYPTYVAASDRFDGNVHETLDGASLQ